MDEKTSQLINKFKNNKALAEKLLQSRDGQQLMALLTRADGGTALQNATSKAAAGNTSELAAMLSGLMKSPEGAAIMQRINEQAKK